jgi:hypothetical protein
MSRDLKIPTIVDGQRVGLTGLYKGNTYKLVKVDGNQVTIRVGDSDVVVPVDSTDLLQRIEHMQKGVKEEVKGNEDVTAALLGTWRQKRVGPQKGDWLFIFSSDGTMVGIHIGGDGEQRTTRWAVEGNAVVFHWPGDGWDEFLLPIDPKETVDVNDLGGHYTYWKVTSP